MATLASPAWNFIVAGSTATDGQQWSGGAGNVFLTGISGGTVALQYCPINSSNTSDWETVTDAYTADGLYGFTLMRGWVRLLPASLTGTVYYKIGGTGIGDQASN
jgi:hypothetical protein